MSWSRAWRAGLVSFDEIVDVLTAIEEEQHVTGLPGTWSEVELREALPALAKLHPDEIRLVLPAPGDPRGLPGPGPFTERALLTGEAVIASRLGLIPEARQHTSGSGDTFTTVLWHAFEFSEAPSSGYSADVSEADQALGAALQEATTQLVRLDVAQWRPELAGALQALRKPDSESELPPGFEPRARRVYARACVLDRVLTLAGQAGTGGAVNSTEMRLREDALRPLAAACRTAIVAACNSPLSSGERST